MSIYQHFRPEEKPFIDQVTGWLEFVERTYAPKLTDFLNPREQLIVKSIVGDKGMTKYEFFGGHEQCERKRALLFPDYYEPQEEDFQVGYYQVIYPEKFVHLEHRMVLGSLMSLGLKRDKYGDIIKNGDNIHFFSSAEIEDYLLTQLTEIGNAKVKLNKKLLSEAIVPQEHWRESVITSSSLRLDTLLASAYSISRQKAQTLIEQKLVTLNWEVIELPSIECEEGDVISARRLGRCKVMDVLGRTKKDRWRIKIGLLK